MWLRNPKNFRVSEELKAFRAKRFLGNIKFTVKRIKQILARKAKLFEARWFHLWRSIKKRELNCCLNVEGCESERGGRVREKLNTIGEH